MPVRVFRRRILTVLTGLLLTCSIGTAHAQMRPSADLFVGVSTLRDLGTDSQPATDYDTGWVVSAAVPAFWHRLSLAGELGSNARTNIVDETQRLTAGLGGGRVTLLRSGRLSVFGQALAGMEWFSEPGFDESGAAFQPGAGLDVTAWSSLGIRGQVDWRVVKHDSGTYKELRVAVGAVMRFGQ